MKKAFFFALACMLVLPVSAWAELTTITFDELPSQPANGVSLKGVTFGFTGGTAEFNAENGGQETYVQDPALVGDTVGTLTVTFVTPTPNLSFGVALSAVVPVTAGFTVALTGPSGPIGTYPVKVSVPPGPGDIFAQAGFNYSGAPVTQATITFNSAVASAFAVDNLTFGTLTAAPIDVKTLALLALAIAGLGGLAIGGRAKRERG